jgi:cytochrome P450
MTDSELPKGIDLTPLNEAFKENPYKSLAMLREKSPVFEDSDLKRYIYSKHDDVKAILRDAEHWSDPRKANPGTFTYEFLGGNLDSEEEPSMLLMDEPGHRRLRSLVSSSFTPKAVEKWRPRTREIIERVLAQIFEAHPDGEFDLIKEFAGPIPTVVIAEMLGIDPAMHADFKEWSDTSVVTAFNPFATEEQKTAGDVAANKLSEFFKGEISARRMELGDDLISDMIRAEESGDKLTEIEMIRQANLLLIAGNVTTTDLIGNCVKALLDNPAQAQALRNRPELISNTIEEALRFDSPVINSGRISSREIEISGCPVGKGESLSTSLAAANHDPDVYPKPETFDIERKDTHHQSFGGGRHLCLGAHLARLEAQEAVLALIKKYPNLQHSPKGYEHHAIPSFRGMSHFWVKG